MLQADTGVFTECCEGTLMDETITRSAGAVRTAKKRTRPPWGTSFTRSAANRDNGIRFTRMFPTSATGHLGVAWARAHAISLLVGCANPKNPIVLNIGPLYDLWPTRTQVEATHMASV
jgi:hypothetical protein